MAKSAKFIVAFCMFSTVALYVAMVFDTLKYFDHELNYNGPKNVLYEDVLGFGYYATIIIFIAILVPLMFLSIKLRISKLFTIANSIIFLSAATVDCLLVRSIERIVSAN